MRPSTTVRTEGLQALGNDVLTPMRDHKVELAPTQPRETTKPCGHQGICACVKYRDFPS